MGIFAPNNQSGAPPVVTISASGSQIPLAFNQSGTISYDLTLTADCAFPIASGSATEFQLIYLTVRQDQAGGHAISFPPRVSWANGSTPQISTTPGSITLLTLATSDGGKSILGAGGLITGGSSLDQAGVISLIGNGDLSSASVTPPGGSPTSLASAAAAGLAAPGLVASEAAARAAADALALPLTGGTITGPLALAVLPTAPAAPASGAILYSDANGGLHIQTPGYNYAFTQYRNDSTGHAWQVGNTGFGNTASNNTNDKPNVYIQKNATNSFNSQSAAMILTDNIGQAVTGNTCSVFMSVNGSSTQPGAGNHNTIQMGSHIQAGCYGNPTGANIISEQLNANFSSATNQVGGGSQCGLEIDVRGGGQDDAMYRIVLDIICAETVPSPSGMTSFGYGVKVRPLDTNIGHVTQPTGPCHIVYPFLAETHKSYPGSYLDNAYAADGGAINGINFFSTINLMSAAANYSAGVSAIDLGLTIYGSGCSIGNPVTGAGIAAGTLITSIVVNPTPQTVTIGLSIPTTGAITLAQRVSITCSYQTGINLSGYYATAIMQVAGQFGQELFLQNGLVLGNGTAGGVGTLFAQNGIASAGPIASAGRFCAARVVTGGMVSVQATDETLVIRKATGSATSVTLPSPSGVGRCLTVKDGKGDAATNQITLVGAVDGGASYVINTAYGLVSVVSDGMAWNVVARA